MGVHLSLEYPHFRNLQPRYLKNLRVEELAWEVRLQLRCAESCHLKVPLDLLFSIDGATVNGLRMTFRWEIEEALEDEQGVPVLGVCDCDPGEWPDLIMLSANSSMTRGFEALLRSVLVHELGHGVCDGPGWLTAYRRLMLSGSSASVMSSDTMRALTPDERHLFAGGDTASKFAEFRANVFMGAFLVPQPLVLEPLRYYARKLDVPLIEAPRPSGPDSARHAGSCRILPHHDDHGHFRLRPLFRALAPEFGVSPRFIHVRLLRYGLLAGQAVETVARDRTFHPVREYLDALRWDGQPRLDFWLISYLGVPDTAYARAVGARWLVSAVARIYMPGAKVDCVLILEGPQGLKKSTALRTLSDPWFADRLSDLGSKDAAMETKGVWIIEIAELDSMTRSEVGAIKGFISRTHDRFRPPYGKRLVDLPRQCAFAGTLNPEGGYLKDATGGRRFWPVLCTRIDIDRLAADRDQLWAEARARFDAGEPWWLDTVELNAAASEEQEDRYQADAWEEPIRHYLEHDVQWNENGYGERKAYSVRRQQPLTDVSVAEVLEHALGIEPGRWSQIDQNRVSRCLVSMGFTRHKVRRDGRRQWRYRLAGAARRPGGPSGPTS